jgi:hypothetical protein
LLSPASIPAIVASRAGVIRAAIEEPHDFGLLRPVASAEPVDVGRALHRKHLARNVRQGRLMFRRVRQQEHPVAQGRTAKASQGAPDAHAAGRLPRRQADKEGKEFHGVVTSKF